MINIEEICRQYYEPFGNPMKYIVDKIINKIGGISDCDKDDFYSLAWFTLYECFGTYNGIGTFDGYFKMCLERKIYSEITKRNCQKRKAKNEDGEFIQDVSLDVEIDGELLLNMVSSPINIEETVFKDDEFSARMEEYLKRLSKQQRNILFLMADGYSNKEIKESLHITGKELSDSLHSIRSYDLISIFF